MTCVSQYTLPTSFHAADAIHTSAHVDIAYYRHDGKIGKLHDFRVAGTSYAFETDKVIFSPSNDTGDNGFNVYRGRGQSAGELYDVYKCGSNKKYVLAVAVATAWRFSTYSEEALS